MTLFECDNHLILTSNRALSEEVDICIEPKTFIWSYEQS